MPEILAELIELILSAKEDESILEGFSSITNKFMGSKSKLLKKAIKGMSGAQEVNMRKAIGDEFTDRIKSHFKMDINKNKAVEKFSVEARSSWIKDLSWDPKLSTLSLNVKEGKRRDNPYKLPFFPKSAIVLIKAGASPGKTIWRKYWRLIGKGKFSNKAKNLFKIKTKQYVVKITSKIVPTIKVPKVTPKKLQTKNLIKKPTVKTANVPKTGVKGIKITIKTPKPRRH